MDLPIHKTLSELVEALDSLAKKVTDSGPDDRDLNTVHGWHHVAANRRSLGIVALELSKAISESGCTKLDKGTEAYALSFVQALNRLESTTVQYFYNGNGHHAVAAYLGTLSVIREALEPVLGSQTFEVNQLPPAVARRLRAYTAQLDEIAPETEALRKKIETIEEAHEAAESLPTDLGALKEARKKIEDAKTHSLLMVGEIENHTKAAESNTQQIVAHYQQAAELVEKCEQAYRITTTKGLAAAFDERARSLSHAKWYWFAALVVALGAGYLLGAHRLTELKDALNTAGQVWPNALLAFVSLGGPIWLAWLATKQIAQNFRLAEDYAFKASIAKAYEGYRKEAARLDKAFEARLFANALTRLEEAPLRLVEAQTPGSPWHELIESDGFREALDKVPSLAEAYKKLRKKAVKRNGSKAEQLEKAALED